MAQREPQDILKQLREQSIPIYSFSRLEAFHQCLYQSYRTYILNDYDNAAPSVYGILGGKIHDALERLQNNEVTEEYLWTALNEEIEDMDMLALNFPKVGDNETLVRDNWVANMEHFCKTYKKPKGKFKTEQFFLYETPHHHFLQGYIDLTKFNKNGTIDIYDYKSSSMYSADDIQAHARQLIIYALAMEQQGYEVSQIAWIFLKYVTVKYEGYKTIKSKNKTPIEKMIERRKLVKDLKPAIEQKLTEAGYDEFEIEFMMDEAEKTNTIPAEVADQFKVMPYVKYYPLTDETRTECIKYIESTIEMWESLDKKEESYEPRSFTKLLKSGKEVDDTFFCTALCSYRKVCPHIKNYLIDKALENISDEELF